jgi:hypothetical protein
MPLTNPLYGSTANNRNNIQVGAVGLEIELAIKEGYATLDVSQATIKKIIIKKPDGSATINDAQFGTTGTDGIITYQTQSGDLNLVGTYSVQAYLEMDTFKGYSTVTTFAVSANL